VRFPVHLPLSSPRVALCAVVIIEPPYSIPDPWELTACLRHNWLWIRAQNQSSRQDSHHLEPTQVERYVPLTHNINSDSQSKVATSISIIDRRGEQNIPKRYLRDAEWLTGKYLGEGYYIADPNDEDTFCAVDFNFDTLQWGLTEPIEDKFRVTRPAPIKYGLQIFDKERQE
jgi:hypothetical protein